MVFYCVTVEVKTSRVAEWVTWMKEHHIPDVVATGCFFSARMLRAIDSPTPSEAVRFRIEYQSPDAETLATYRSQFAPELQQAHNAIFGQDAQAWREVLVVEELFASE